MKFKKSLAFIAFVFAFQSCSFDSVRNERLNNADTAAAASVHGMVLFGTNKIYMSHIPMFHAPHDYQALFEVELAHQSVDAMATYKKQLAADGSQKLVTLRPSPFVLPDLLNGDLTSIKASLFNGNFEQGGSQVLSNVTVKVNKVVYQKRLSLSEQPLSQLTYLALQDQNKVFLVHKISAPNSFDQIVEASFSQSDEAQSFPTEVVVVGKTDVVQNKLFSSFQIPPGQLGTSFFVKTNFYCLVGPHFTANCPN